MNKPAFILGVMFLHGCGNGGGIEQHPSWQLAESNESPPPELWWGDPPSEHVINQVFPECDSDAALQGKLVLRFEAPLDPPIRGELWFSPGGSLAYPTRHWFKCSNRPFTTGSEIVTAMCSATGSAFIQLHNPDHPTGLPDWIVEIAAWENKISGKEAIEQEASPPIAEFTIPVRWYDADSERIFSGRFEWIIPASGLMQEHSTAFTSDLNLSEPICGEPRGIRGVRDFKEITDQCTSPSVCRPASD